MKNCNRPAGTARYLRSFLPAAGFLITALSLSGTAHAQGDLMLFPKRIVFDGTRKTQEINLANSGKDTARYILSVVQIRMKEDGSFENITEPDPGQQFADKFFRIFPRNVVLPPNEAQTVKVQLINTSELQPGEYRSHIYVRAEEEKTPLGEDDKVKDSKAISVNIKAVFGISIPVIIRSGETSARISISELSLVQEPETPPTAKFTFHREGNMSTYGDVSIDHIAPDGKITRVGTANGLSVYTPTLQRHISLPLNKPAGLDLHSGSLLVTYQYSGQKAESKMVLHPPVP